MSTRELIEKEIANLPENLQRKVYEFAGRLKSADAGEGPLNGVALRGEIGSEWDSPDCSDSD